MKKINILLAVTIVLTSCAIQKTLLYMESAAPEESGLNLNKITNESNNSVISGASGKITESAATAQRMTAKMITSSSINLLDAYTNQMRGINAKNNFTWNVQPSLSISPDGKKLAYITRSNNADNVLICNANGMGMSTQRTFRNVSGFSWGNDNKLYFSDTNGDYSYVNMVNAESGNIMNQLTNGNVRDYSPILSYDENLVFFTRSSTTTGPSIWFLDRRNGLLTSCTRGFSPCLIKDNPNAFCCVRNSSTGRSEIWLVDYVKGEESIILTDENRSFTNPKLSPDGKWLVCVGNSTSSINQKVNTDIFVVKVDGTNLTQLTYHPASDNNPVWSADGRSIYFISSRANKTESYNVWRMNFDME